MSVLSDVQAKVAALDVKADEVVADIAALKSAAGVPEADVVALGNSVDAIAAKLEAGK